MLNELFATTFGRVFFTLVSSPAATILALVSVFVLCIVFQVTALRRTNKNAGKPLGATHFVWTTLFVLYLLVVYRLTGIGTLWNVIGGREISTSTIYLVPLASFMGGGFYGFLFFALNVVMTVPLGLFLAALWPKMRSWKRIALAGFCFSLAIELSQLFTNRGTNVDDLIANTLGAVVGYVLFVAVDRLRQRKISNREQSYRQEQLQARQQERLQVKHQALSRSKVLRNEGIIYVVLSFVGMFLFFNPAWVSTFDVNFSERHTFAGGGTTVHQDFSLHGVVLEVSADGLLLGLNHVEDIDDGAIMANTDQRLFVHFTEETTVAILRIDESETVFPVALETGTQDIRVGDSVDLFFNQDFYNVEESDPNNPATHIIVWRFS